MERKHGLSQYRLNHAKDYAKMFAEKLAQIDLIFKLSIKGLIDDEVAENFISSNIEELDMEWQSFKEYIVQRDDMR